MTRLRTLVLILGCLFAAGTVVAGCGSSSSSGTSASANTGAASTAAVKVIQTDLATVGCYAGTIDGISGPQTTSALRNFQTATGLTADGIYGQQTAAALTAADHAGKIVCTSSGSSTSTSTTSTNSGGSGAGATACNPRVLAVSLNTSGSGAAGSSYYALTFTNGSGVSCTVTGYPGVSAVSRSGAQLGNAAGRSTTTAAAKITLASGARATSTLQITDVSNYTASTCGPTTAFGVKVYAPNSLTYHILTFAFRACSKTGTTYMLVSPVAAG